jgi:hypothetical protein
MRIEFLPLQGDVHALKLLVDSGFTGKSSVILPKDKVALIRAEIPATHVSGALEGAQDRGWVTCRIPGLNFRCTLIAIFADLGSLSLPPGIQGMVGLSFLRNFARWGAEKVDDAWRFFLSDGNQEKETNP